MPFSDAELLPPVRLEVQKPFEEKLQRARQLIKLWIHQKSCVSCSFGKDSTVLLHLCLEADPHCLVVFENTGIEFKETLEFRDRMVKEWDLNFVELKPELTYWQILDRILHKGLGLDDGKKRSNICCYHMKEKPFSKFAKQQGIRVSFAGITALESRNRMFSACQKGMEYYSQKFSYLKVHPLLYWRESEVWDFIRSRNLPVNEAYEKYGLSRMGCVPCTSHKNWREQLFRINPRMYKLIQEKYFRQKTWDQEQWFEE